MKRGNIALVIVGVIIVAILAISFLAPDLFTGKIVADSEIILIAPVSVESYKGTTCLEDNAKIEDGEYAGIVRTGTGGLSTFSNKIISSCIKLNYGEEYEISGVQLKYRTVERTCDDGCIGDDCGTGGTGYIFLNGERGNWQYVDFLKRETEAAMKKSWKGKKGVNEILICRTNSPHKEDNIEVDYVHLMVERELAGCIDSDGGKNYYEKGITKGDVEERDNCWSDEATLTEYYCDEDGFVKEEAHVCEKGCVDGACIL